MPGARPNVLLINAAKVYPAPQWAQITEDATVSVITLPAYAHRYPDAAHMRVIDSLYDFGEVIRAATEISQVTGLEYVIGPAERSVPAAGLVRSYFGLPGTGFEAALRHSNKHLMKLQLRAAGLPVTDWTSVPRLTDLPDALRTLKTLPVVVKPVFGGGAQNTFVVSSEAAAEALVIAPEGAGLRAVEYPLIIERFVDIQVEYHCDGIVVDGEVRFAAVSNYLSPKLGSIGELGGSFGLDPQSAECREVQALHRKTVQALGLDSGVTHMEVLQTASGMLIGEITCRPGGAGIPELLDLQYGVDIWQAFTDIALGREPNVATRPEDRRILMADLPIRAGRITALSTAADLESVPEVLQVDMQAAVGDVIEAQKKTGNTTGRVFLGLSDPNDLAVRLEQLSAAFTYEIASESVQV